MKIWDGESLRRGECTAARTLELPSAILILFPAGHLVDGLRLGLPEVPCGEPSVHEQIGEFRGKVARNVVHREPYRTRTAVAVS